MIIKHRSGAGGSKLKCLFINFVVYFVVHIPISLHMREQIRPLLITSQPEIMLEILSLNSPVFMQFIHFNCMHKQALCRRLKVRINENRM